MKPLRSIWKGHIRFSLVTIPIRIYNAVLSADEIRHGEKEVAQSMAAYPFTQHQDLAQVLYRTRHIDTQSIFNGLEACHLVRTTAKTTDS